MEEKGAKPKQKLTEVIGFIGAGKMATALALGFVTSGLVPADKIVMSSPETEPPELKKRGIVNYSSNNLDVVNACDIIIIAVKPNVVPKILKEIGSHVQPSKHTIISIAAGLTIDYFEKGLPACTPVVRVIPNISCFVNESTSSYTLGKHCGAYARNIVHSLLRCVGSYEEVPEYLQDSVGAVSGCGPGFTMVFIEALADGAVRMGVPRPLALKFAAQTVMGSAKLLLETGKHPGQVKDEVCSPGGTTIAGIHKLEKAGFRGAVMDAIEAATVQSQKLGTH